ncbi:MAG TPA: hypothetical protein VED41_10085, partial [Solirubrobacteraceae bacterium]|nr:hypothetical protein [Solirubrobacteraceae bacterium]
FALQRTGARGTGAARAVAEQAAAAPPGLRSQWLLVKRRDEHARPGSDVVAERPQSVLSGRTLGQVLADRSA